MGNLKIVIVRPNPGKGYLYPPDRIEEMVKRLGGDSRYLIEGDGYHIVKIPEECYIRLVDGEVHEIGD